MKFPAVLAATLVAISVFASAAPVPVTGTMTYTQDFNALGNGALSWGNDATLPGWYAQINDGNTANGAVQVSNGTSGSLSGLLNLGATGDPERALGSKATSAGNLANIAFGVLFQNTGTAPVKLSRIGWTGELWRTNTTTGGLAETYTLFYQISSTKITNLQSGTTLPDALGGEGFYPLGAGANWSSPTNLPVGSALNGNAAANRTVISFIPPPIALDPGEFLMIKWTDSNLDGTDGQQGVDDVSVEFTSMAGVPGTPEAGFNPNADRGADAVIAQPDGKIIVGGQFNQISGVTRKGLIRMNHDGSPDNSFLPSGYDSTFTLGLQDDGKLILGGQFGIFRLNPDGTRESTFAPAPDERVAAVVIQDDGRIIIGGIFTMAGGAVRNHAARLNADGSLDTAFNPNVNSWVLTGTAQGDGKVILGGPFTTVAGGSYRGLVRLNANGSLDTGFHPVLAGTNLHAYAAAVQADGKIVIGGLFTSVNGVNRSHIARLNADGTLDASFNAGTDDRVNSIILQCDGGILITGDFKIVNGTPRNSIARLNAAGTLDPVFDPNVDNPVSGLWLQSDGKILVAGPFSQISGLRRGSVARLENGPATQSMTVSRGSVKWLRGGTSPETLKVTFDVSTDGGGSWTSLGAGARIPGGWERTALSLPASGSIRARARITGSDDSNSSAPLETLTAYSFPDIAVEQPAGTNIPEGGVVLFDNVEPGGELDRTFTLRNDGPADLTGLSAFFDGADAPAFSLTSLPADTVPAGGTTEWTVKFAPSSPGLKSASLHLAGNGTKDIFDVSLTGTGLSSLEAWRQFFFETPANEGPAANNADPDGDGLENLMEFALGLNPVAADAGTQPKWHWQDDDFILSFTTPANVSGITYVAEYNTSLTPAGWTAIPNSSVTPNYTWFAPVGTGQRIFLRLRVTVP